MHRRHPAQADPLDSSSSGGDPPPCTCQLRIFRCQSSAQDSNARLEYMCTCTTGCRHVTACVIPCDTVTSQHACSFCRGFELLAFTAGSNMKPASMVSNLLQLQAPKAGLCCAYRTHCPRTHRKSGAVREGMYLYSSCMCKVVSAGLHPGSAVPPFQ